MAEQPRRAILFAFAMLLVLAFFGVSGACGLVYQVVWTRKLVLLFGCTSYAVSTVLSIFFLGLGAGAFYGGRLADRSADEAPLLYAVGASALYQVGMLAVVLRFLSWCASLDPRVGPFVATLVIFTAPMTLLAMTGPFVTRLLARGDHVCRLSQPAEYSKN